VYGPRDAPVLMPWMMESSHWYHRDWMSFLRSIRTRIGLIPNMILIIPKSAHVTQQQHRLPSTHWLNPCASPISVHGQAGRIPLCITQKTICDGARCFASDPQTPAKMKVRLATNPKSRVFTSYNLYYHVMLAVCDLNTQFNVMQCNAVPTAYV
jgi:hypothetical protein